MSSLWTPSGEHPVDDEGDAGPVGGPSAGPGEGPSAEQMEALRAQLASAPAEVVVANHCYGLFELAAVYLSQQPPLLFQARLAIDGLGALVDGLEGRLGDAEPSLREALAQLRLAYVNLEGAERTAAEQAAARDAPGATPGAPG